MIQLFVFGFYLMHVAASSSTDCAIVIRHQCAIQIMNCAAVISIS